MKKFIIKILLLCIVPIIALVSVLIVFRYKIENIKLSESTHILILGDSHTQTGLNDRIIKNSLNISQSSEHFLYTFNVLKLLLTKNNPIDKVILGVSFHSFSKKKMMLILMI